MGTQDHLLNLSHITGRYILPYTPPKPFRRSTGMTKAERQKTLMKYQRLRSLNKQGLEKAYPDYPHHMNLAGNI